MTAEEAIEILDNFFTKIANFGSYVADEEFDAIFVAIEALEKSIPKKVNKEILDSNAFTQWRKYNCPNCGYFLYSGSSSPISAQPYCHHCGQALDWSEA